MKLEILKSYSPFKFLDTPPPTPPKKNFQNGSAVKKTQDAIKIGNLSLEIFRVNNKNTQKQNGRTIRSNSVQSRPRHQLDVGSHNSTCQGEITPLIHLFSAIYRGRL